MKTNDIVYIALFAALMAALGVFPPISIPALGGVPITAQSMGIMLAGGILGARRGALSIILFLVLVAVGLPLLSGGRGGLAAFAGPSAGFIYGWVICAFIIGLAIEAFWDRLNVFNVAATLTVAGIFLLYAIGIPWLAVVAGIPFEKAFFGSVAYIPGDAVKMVVATAVILTVKRSYPLINR
ncbi:biotin transporter BioY [Sneathiella chinensis]|uniref:Biotin transporter n=1 Tax=Sneathiella chinensis TaxID=349750 RepID=A0ABQ5U3U5_9PROT|nr:biotin transporter BioY [Sneathiella chinensis]GLQ06814.1 biotin transporter BioY [Sneathiella chinensis]